MLNNKRILIIDDDPTQIAILNAYFSSMNAAEVISACDGLQASEKLEKQTRYFDYIFSDLGMPNVDGFELLKFLSAHKYKGKVVIISGHEKILLDSAASLGKMYGLSIAGQIKKPLTKFALDRLFEEQNENSSSQNNSAKNTITAEQIADGIAANQFVPYYQPKIDLLSGKVVGAEALARWLKPDGSVVSPGAFIPVAENTVLIENITVSIIDSVIADYCAGGENWVGKKIAINLPPQMIRNTDLPEFLEYKLADNAIPNSALCIEITESGIIDFDAVTIEVLSRLRIKGFDLAIDDFGTGAANIANLKVFPYSELKIDQSFINNVLTDPISAETVRTSISLARQLGLRIVAEGIETKDDLQYVKSKGIDQAQGYLFSKPLPFAQIDEMFKNPLLWLTQNKQPANSTAA